MADFPEEEETWKWGPHYSLIRDIREGRGCRTMELLWEANILKDRMFSHDYSGGNLQTGCVKGTEEHGVKVLTGRSNRWECVFS